MASFRAFVALEFNFDSYPVPPFFYFLADSAPAVHGDPCGSESATLSLGAGNLKNIYKKLGSEQVSIPRHLALLLL
jgi:hypothetical protein